MQIEFCLSAKLARYKHRWWRRRRTVRRQRLCSDIDSNINGNNSPCERYWTRKWTRYWHSGPSQSNDALLQLRLCTPLVFTQRHTSRTHDDCKRFPVNRTVYRWPMIHSHLVHRRFYRLKNIEIMGFNNGTLSLAPLARGSNSDAR